MRSAEAPRGARIQAQGCPQKPAWSESTAPPCRVAGRGCVFYCAQVSSKVTLAVVTSCPVASAPSFQFRLTGLCEVQAAGNTFPAGQRARSVPTCAGLCPRESPLRPATPTHLQ